MGVPLPSLREAIGCFEFLPEIQNEKNPENPVDPV
jgi:hypothetical protein